MVKLFSGFHVYTCTDKGSCPRHEDWASDRNLMSWLAGFVAWLVNVRYNKNGHENAVNEASTAKNP